MILDGYVYRRTEGLKNDPRLDVVNGVILHVSASSTAVSLFNYFDGPSQGIESHAHIPKTPDHPKEQYRGTNREADANYKANSWLKDGKRHGFLSVETQGGGSGRWTPYQIESIKDFILQTSKEHGFPLKVPKDWNSKGVGYHTQFSEWSNVRGKTCPGPERIEQYWDIIVPWMKELNVKVYIWQQGDTVRNVCRKFGLTTLELWKLNPGSDLPFLRGQEVRVR